MIKRLLFTCIFAGILNLSVFCRTVAAAADPYSMQILGLAELGSDFGSPTEFDDVNTYEDVNNITGIGPRFSGVGPILSPGILNSDYNHVIKDDVGMALLKKISDNGGMVYKEKDFLDFLMNNFYLDYGEFNSDPIPVWTERSIGSFPHTYITGNRPHKKVFHLCLRGGFEYIPVSDDLKPDAKSCDTNKTLCDYSVCTKEEREDVNGDGDENDPEDVTVEEKHKQTTNNVFTKLGSILHSRREKAVGVESDSSGIEFNITFKDRTPPRIEGCVDGKFPELGINKPATTGDWYKVEGLKITDNVSKKIGTCMVLGKIDKYPTDKWKAEENWIAEPARVIDSGTESDYVIMPNACHGVMRYSVFAWDEDGLVNPGEPGIVENQPEICYGLSEPPVADLLVEPDKALGWPIVATITGALDSIDMTAIDPGERRGEGFVHICDNDLPNILISIESCKDGKKAFFPPVMPPGLLPIFNSTEFNKLAADPNGNANAYSDFVGATPEDAFNTDKLKDPLLGLPPLFKVFDAKPRLPLSANDTGMQSIDIAKLDEFKDITKINFIREHFRLEDYHQSDTKPDGSPDTDPMTFGARNGTGGEVVALLDLPPNLAIQEDVEYKINVWVDDNVKWATIDAGSVLEKIIPVPTGVVSGELVVEIPNQYPRASHRVPFDQQKSVNGNLTVVFREPTPNVPIKGENDLIAAKFPFIDVRATDFAGLTRKIRLYLRVSNENPEIRVLERNHEKNQ